MKEDAPRNETYHCSRWQSLPYPYRLVSCCPCPAGGKALTDTQQWGDLQDVQDEGSSEGEEEDSEGVPSPSNNFNFPPDIVVRFEEGYQGNPTAGMEAMRKTYVSQILASSPPPAACSAMHLASGMHTLNVLCLPTCCRLPGPSAYAVLMESSACLRSGLRALSARLCDPAGVAAKHRGLQHAGAAAAVLCHLQSRRCGPLEALHLCLCDFCHSVGCTHDVRCSCCAGLLRPRRHGPHKEEAPCVGDQGEHINLDPVG